MRAQFVNRTRRKKVLVVPCDRTRRNNERGRPEEEGEGESENEEEDEDEEVRGRSDEHASRGKEREPPRRGSRDFDLWLLPDVWPRPLTNFGEGACSVRDARKMETESAGDVTKVARGNPKVAEDTLASSRVRDLSRKLKQVLDDTTVRTTTTTTTKGCAGGAADGTVTKVEEEETVAVNARRTSRRLSLQVEPQSRKHAHILSAPVMQQHRPRVTADARLSQEQRMHHVHNQAAIAAIAATESGESASSTSQRPPSPYLTYDRDITIRPRSHSTPTIPTHPMIPYHHVSYPHLSQELQDEVVNSAASAAAAVVIAGTTKTTKTTNAANATNTLNVTNITKTASSTNTATTTTTTTTTTRKSAPRENTTRRNTTRITSSDAADASRPHICPECGRGFKRSEHLKRHLMVHTDERPFACAVCQKRFARNDNLAQHARTHGEGDADADVDGDGDGDGDGGGDGPPNLVFNFGDRENGVVK